MNYARANQNKEILTFRTLKEWEGAKLTKLDTAARLCQYLLAGDDLPFPTFSNGTVAFPPIDEGQARKQETKIVIFMEFPSMLPVFTNVSLCYITASLYTKIYFAQVFDLYGIKVLAVNGSMTFNKCAEVIKKFRSDPSFRVLALLSVGNTGMNLAFCRVVIFVVRHLPSASCRRLR